MASSAEQYYTALQNGKEDYYLDVPGEWAGKGAAPLGLSGSVTREAHIRLFQGFDPEDPDRKLVQNAGQMKPYAPTKEGEEGKRGRKPGWDLTVSADKSVSVLHALGSKEERAELREDQLFAARAVVSHFEARSVTRTGKGGTKEEPAHLVAALIPHTTARPVGKNAPDPQCHVHILIYNVAVSPNEKMADGKPKTRSLWSEQFYELQREGYGVFSEALRTRLEKRYEIEKTATDWRVKGIPHELCEAFSKRSRLQIEPVSPRGTPAWDREKAAKDTRSPKGKFTSHELDTSWQKTALAHGITREHVQALRLNGTRAKEVTLPEDEKRPEARPKSGARAEPGKGERQTPWVYELPQKEAATPKRDAPKKEPTPEPKKEAAPRKEEARPKEETQRKEEAKPQGKGPTIVSEPRGVYSDAKEEKPESYFKQGYVKETDDQERAARAKANHEVDKRLIREHVKDLEKSSRVLGVTWRSSDAEKVEREIGIPALSVHRSMKNLESEAGPSALDVLKAHWRYATWQSTAKERDSVIRQRENASRYEMGKGTTVLFVGHVGESLEAKDFLREAKRYGAKVLFTEELLPKLRGAEQTRRSEELAREEFSQKTAPKKTEAKEQESQQAQQTAKEEQAPKEQTKDRGRERVREMDSR